MGAEAVGLGEAVVQHLCRLDTQHFILVSVESVFNSVFRPFHNTKIPPNNIRHLANVSGAITSECQDKLANPTSLA